MTEIPISPQIWKLAQAILTQKQHDVLRMRELRGFSWNMLAITFNCTRANVREHHRAASKNLLDAIEAAGGIDEALERTHAKQQLDWMDEMERTEKRSSPTPGHGPKSWSSSNPGLTLRRRRSHET